MSGEGPGKGNASEIGVESFDGCRIVATIEGDPALPSVLFVNSIGLDRSMWDGQAAALAGHCRIIRYDSRGHGASDVPDGEYTIDMLGRDTVAVLDAAGADRASLVGCSIGGMTAIWVAASCPDRVGGLVLANTTAHIGRPEIWQQRIALVRQRGMDAVAQGTADRWLSEGFRSDRPQEAIRLTERLRTTPADGFAGMCAVLRDVDLRDLLPSIRAPTLLIGAGGGGPETGAAGWLANAIAGARFHQMRSAGHLSNWEDPEEFNAALSGFLDGDRA